MDSTRWRHLKALFEAALDRPPEERTSFLDEACAGDEELRQELESLLMAAAGSGPFDALADEFVSPLLADLEDDADLLMPTLEGRRVGPYEIARRIGQGGMGAVYLAERADGQFEQQVALKLVRHGLHGTEGARRFLAERQILARLQHPHIARLLDGGITEDGQPYFAMEYVDGLPLDAYCDEHELGIETRLRLFQTVCDAVHYAHQNLIVHRDLKPSNILVTEDPGSGPGQAPQVKLLDFGIAKLIDVEDEGDLLTRTGMPVLTPAYASPEQVRCQPITTASDVYTLGVVLFELLTGQRPYDVQGRSPSEVEEMVCETEPPAPSAIVTRPAPGSASDAPPTRTSGSPEVLRRRLAGDLDTIILKAMQKEPGRRYASAEALRDDLQRHLDGLPVTARPSTLGYRARTFVRRHRTGVTAAALVALAVLAGIVGTVWQARVAAQERDAARQEAAKAERVASFLIDVFETPDPSEARGDTITAREILDRGARRVRTELAAEPAVQAQMMDVIGRVYQNLGLYDRAGALLDEALTLRRTTPDVAPGDLAASLHHKAVLLHARGAYDAADSLYQRALQMRRDRAA
ncbi:MAG: protein kinase, partial [Bacteroidetes bacterium]|nr:protein kinase [Bacteroidota bacterium]